MDIASLIRVIDARPRTFDWDAIAEGWGRTPPADYIDFMHAVGPGNLGDYMSIKAPTADLGDDGEFAMAIATQGAQLAWKSGNFPKAGRLADAEPRLLCWAVSDDANQYCWDLADDSMPIIVFDRGFLEWTAYDLSFTDFVVGMIQDSIPNYAGDQIASELGWQVPVTYKVHKRDHW
ncbi:MAG: hypothetical protein ACRDPS_10825 [Nocardioides sp.]|uniref:hypothetical protein n=1 Tax=Nocardioides sp. TaxID=35761 RepID=UPI003D6B2B2E